jgi:hypothetical protein
MLRKIAYASLGLILIASVIFGKVSYGLPKSRAAQFEMKSLMDYANNQKELILNISHVDNASFVSAIKPTGTIWKYNEKGEVLDPWGQPYVISKNNDQITITSPGLDQYNKLSSLQKWWNDQ